jgi:hypothetical protein
LASVNEQIAKKAGELAELLARRSDLHNTSGFSSDTYYHVCDVIRAAGQTNGLFKWYTEERLNGLTYQFDLKYWPSLSQFLLELSSDAADAVVEATDSLTAVATVATRGSTADFIKALLVAIEENSAENFGHLPRDFKLTDGTLASLTNCALDLNPDEAVDAGYIKRFRQRERDARARQDVHDQ